MATFIVLRAVVNAAEEAQIPYTVGGGITSDAFYAPHDPDVGAMINKANIVSVEMESDTLFVVGAYRGWRTGALFAADGALGVIKPDWGEADFRQGFSLLIKSLSFCSAGSHTYFQKPGL